mgnify:CR=1 FL=1
MYNHVDVRARTPTRLGTPPALVRARRARVHHGDVHREDGCGRRRRRRRGGRSLARHVGNRRELLANTLFREFRAIYPDPEQLVDSTAAARVNGFLDKQAYIEGQIVSPGQLLFQMDQKPFIAALDEAQAAWQKAKAAHDTAVANLNRVKPLAAQNALSQKDLDDSTGNEQATAAALAQAKCLRYIFPP